MHIDKSDANIVNPLSAIWEVKDYLCFFQIIFIFYVLYVMSLLFL